MAKAGDIVFVDSSVFMASPLRTGELRECVVLEDSKASQTYVTKTNGTDTPMYVWNHLLVERKQKDMR